MQAYRPVSEARKGMQGWSGLAPRRESRCARTVSSWPPSRGHGRLRCGVCGWPRLVVDILGSNRTQPSKVRSPRQDATCRGSSRWTCDAHVKAKGLVFEGEDLYIGEAAIQQEVAVMAGSSRQVEDYRCVNAALPSPSEQAIDSTAQHGEKREFGASGALSAMTPRPVGASHW